MGQKNFVRNISGTACAVWVLFSTMNINSTTVIDGNIKHEIQKVNYSHYSKNSTNPFVMNIDNIYEINPRTRLEKEANMLFGEMRYATVEEQNSINQYIKNISKDTGVSFFNIC